MFNAFLSYEPEFESWVRDGYPGLKPETYDYLRFLTSPADDRQPRDGTLWPHQWEAFLRAIYVHEILKARGERIGSNGVLLNIVTGGGKTAIIAALMAYFRIAHNVGRFLVLCPNLIVRDRLESDFRKGKVFKDRDLLPHDGAVRPDDFHLQVLGSGGESVGMAGLLGASVILSNIHQFYLGTQGGQSRMAGVMNGPDFVVFNDEAHNTPAEQYTNTLKAFSPRQSFRVDTTATPDRADNAPIDTDMIVEYSVRDALVDRVIKTPVVYRPNIATVELTYTDAKTGERKKVEEIDWSEVDRAGITATQWVTDDEPMRQQMTIALNRIKEQRLRAKGRYNPILFVVAVCIADAKKARDTLEKTFGVRTLLVTEESDEAERKKAMQLGNFKDTNRIDAVVSVLMLREGWDVPEVGVILLLRKFSSKVYGQQAIGRGLRRVRRPGMEDDDQQICAVVDHPKLDHDWLWKLFESKVRENVGVDDEFSEKEDVPEPKLKQEITNPDNVIPIPDEHDLEDDGNDFGLIDPVEPEPVTDWKAVLDAFEYPSQDVEITAQVITEVVGRELTGLKWKSIQSPDDFVAARSGLGKPPVEKDPEVLRTELRDRILRFAREACEREGFSADAEGTIYKVTLAHVSQKFMGGHTLGLASVEDLRVANRRIGLALTKIAYTVGLLQGIALNGA
jgi:superfamily II DNA or RNA helicase